MVMDKVTVKVTMINLNMFSPFMKNIIMRNMNSTPVVIVYMSRQRKETPISYNSNCNKRSFEVVSVIYSAHDILP